MSGLYVFLFVLIVLLVGHNQSKDVSEETLEKSKVSFNYLNSSEDMGEEIHTRRRCDCLCGDHIDLPVPPSIWIREGEIAERHEFPWLALLYVYDGIFVHCGGALVTMRHVLTAAHCFFGLAVSILTVVLGVHFPDHDFKKTKQWRKVSRAVLHPHYHNVSLVNDIGVLEMDAEVTLTYAVKPACFPVSGEKDFTGRTAVLAAWGMLTPDLLYPTKLMKVDLKVLSNTECKSTTEIHASDVTDDMICAGFPDNDKGACKGDSGSPLHVTNSNGIREIIGVVSWTISFCSSAESPVVFARVSKYMTWIDQQLGNHCRCVPKSSTDEKSSTGCHPSSFFLTD